MPIEYSIDKERRRVRAVVSGDFTTSDILRAITDSVADPDFEAGFGILSDHSRIGRPITTEQLHDMTGYLRSLGSAFSGARWAVVATKPASYGMMRMLSVMAEDIPMEVEVFGTLEDAEAWLDGRVNG